MYDQKTKQCKTITLSYSNAISALNDYENSSLITSNNKQKQLLHINGTLNSVAGMKWGSDEDVKFLMEHPHILKQTLFDQLTGNFIVKNGEVNHHFILASSHFTVQGEGNLNLINETIDDQLDIIPLNTSALKWTIPVLIEGPLRDPTIRLDMLKLKAMITQEQIEKVKTKVQKEIKKLPEQADKLLKNIFGN